ncbi:MAG: UPF0147 family protein [Candidatus Woesearchaeota archaeon]
MKPSEIIDFIDFLLTDSGTQTTVRETLREIKKILGEKGKDIGIQADKCITLLEELDEDPNIEPYTRTNLWNLVSMLEKLKE